MKCSRLQIVIAIACAVSSGACERSATSVAPLIAQASHVDSILNVIARKYSLPAVAGGIVWPESVEVSAVGVARVGTSMAVTSADLFHLGSNTKALTSTMIATLVR